MYVIIIIVTIILKSHAYSLQLLYSIYCRRYRRSHRRMLKVCFGTVHLKITIAILRVEEMDHSHLKLIEQRR